MMLQTYHVLIVEDHPVIIDNYKTALSLVENNLKTISFKTDEATDCKTAYAKIENAALNGGIDFAFLDISLPPDRDNQLFTGEHVGIKIRALLPNARILICTGYNEHFLLSSIIDTINPQAFLIKCDIGFSDLVAAVEKLISNQTYYSQTVVNLLRNKATNKGSLYAIDIKLLYEISNGAKMKELVELLPLTKSGIEKRKKRIKEKFGIAGQSDRAMILAAKEKGLI